MGYKGTTLMMACRYFNPELVSFILSKGAHPDFDTGHSSPLTSVIGWTEEVVQTELDRLECARRLLDAGANADDSDALWAAAYFGDVKVARAMLAADKNEEKARKSLTRLRDELNVSIPEAEFGVGTPLHEAAGRDTRSDEDESDQVDMVKLFIENGADPAQKDVKGRTALDVARIKQNLAVAHYLEGLAKR